MKTTDGVMLKLSYKLPGLENPIKEEQFSSFHKAYRRAEELKGYTRLLESKISSYSESGAVIATTTAPLCKWEARFNFFTVLNRQNYYTILQHCN